MKKCYFLWLILFGLTISIINAENLKGEKKENLSVVIDGQSVPVRYYAFPAENTESSGGVMMFIHGFRSNARYFYPVALAFSKAGYQSFSLELPGYNQASWDTSAELAIYDLPTYGQYVARSLEIITRAEQIDLARLTIWGHSMGSGIVYRAAADHPNLFSCLQSVVFEAPAFADCITKFSKTAIWFSTKTLSLVHRHKQSVSTYAKWLRIEGHADTPRVFLQNANSMLKPQNNITQGVLNQIGMEKIIWLWSPRDIAVYSPPPSFIPKRQRICVAVNHGISHQEPDKVCQAILDRQFKLPAKGGKQ